MVESWKSNDQLASQRLPAIHFLVHNCGANINIQVTMNDCLLFFRVFIAHTVFVSHPSSCIFAFCAFLVHT